MSEKSPYREVGLSAVARPGVRHRAQPHGFSGVARETGHVWGDPNRRLGIRGLAASKICQRCGKPEFSVGNKKCTGKS